MAAPMPDRSGFGLGIIFIIIVAVIWAGASVLTQFIYADLDFKSPFLITYIATALFSLYLPLWRVWVYVGYVEDPPWRLEPSEYVTRRTLSKQRRPLIVADAARGGSNCGVVVDSGAYQAAAIVDAETIVGGQYSSDSDEGLGVTLDEVDAEIYCHLDVIKIAWVVCPLWFIANFAYNYSLLLTSVGSSTIISNLSGSFTLLFSSMAGIEAITYGKVAGLVISLGGVALIGVQDHDNGNTRTLEGDAVALLASAAYGLYTTAIKIKIPKDDGVSMQLLFGYVGLITAVSLSPILFLLGLLNLGNIHDLTGRIFGFLLLGSIFNNVISDYLWARSVVLTTPTVATVGLSITIPFALLSDFIFFGRVPAAMSVSGALLVIGGFVLVSCENRIRKWIGANLPSWCWGDWGDTAILREEIDN